MAVLPVGGGAGRMIDMDDSPLVLLSPGGGSRMDRDPSLTEETQSRYRRYEDDGLAAAGGVALRPEVPMMGRHTREALRKARRLEV